MMSGMFGNDGGRTEILMMYIALSRLGGGGEIHTAVPAGALPAVSIKKRHCSLIPMAFGSARIRDKVASNSYRGKSSNVDLC